MNFVNTTEKYLLSFFRIVAIFVAFLIIISLKIYILYNIYLYSLGPKEFETPQFTNVSDFADTEGVMSRKQRLEREELSKKIFNSKFNDSLEQSKIISSEAFRDIAEINNRFAELVITSNKDDYRSRLELNNEMNKEINNKCESFRVNHISIIDDLEKDIITISRNNKVSKESFSKNSISELKEKQKLPPICSISSEMLQNLSKKIIKLFPGSYGFKGENSKSTIITDVDGIFNYIVSETDSEYGQVFIETTEELVTNMQLYIQKEVKTLTTQNLLTKESLDYLADWIKDEIYQHTNDMIINYKYAKEENELYNSSVSKSKQEIFSGLQSLLFAMLGLTILIVFIILLSIERNVRKN